MGLNSMLESELTRSTCGGGALAGGFDAGAGGRLWLGTGGDLRASDLAAGFGAGIREIGGGGGGLLGASVFDCGFGLIGARAGCSGGGSSKLPIGDLSGAGVLLLVAGGSSRMLISVVRKRSFSFGGRMSR